MKTSLIALTLLASCGATAQEVSVYTPGATPEGVVYYLPKTEIEVQVTATRVTYIPGDFCQYANRYLRLTDLSSQPDTYWELNSIRVQSVGVPDPERAYAVKLKDKSVASQVELTPEGIVRAINTTAPAEKPPQAQAAQVATPLLNPRQFLTEEILMAGSKAKMAELVAREIYNIRESKNSLTRGQADYMPKDGSALKLMLDNLDQQEKALTSLFTGQKEHQQQVFTLRFTPNDSVKSQVAFRFSQRLGVLKSDDLAGTPYYLSIQSQETLPPADPEASSKKKLEGVIYNIPGKALVKLSTPEKTYFEGELPVTQFGTTETLTDNLFNKKINTRVIFNPNTGGIVKIDKD